MTKQLYDLHQGEADAVKHNGKYDFLFSHTSHFHCNHGSAQDNFVNI